ncbi:IniB N-terminal domain-containing protein [Kutzneria kofuensis]|uniref:IniB N-terminal domain-containing protein n=1 Tax=Kutzneria kofuensis TaxID=103725 RepID=UPI0031EED357
MATGISLLDFIMELLGNQTARDQFESNPQQSLDDHGFSHLCAADVHDAMPLVIDAAQSFDRTYDAGGPSHVVTRRRPRRCTVAAASSTPSSRSATSRRTTPTRWTATTPWWTTR